MTLVGDHGLCPHPEQGPFSVKVLRSSGLTSGRSPRPDLKRASRSSGLVLHRWLISAMTMQDSEPRLPQKPSRVFFASDFVGSGCAQLLSAGDDARSSAQVPVDSGPRQHRPYSRLRRDRDAHAARLRDVRQKPLSAGSGRSVRSIPGAM